MCVCVCACIREKRGGGGQGDTARVSKRSSHQIAVTYLMIAHGQSVRMTELQRSSQAPAEAPHRMNPIVGLQH